MTAPTPFRILTLAIFIALIIPMSIQDGMFLDGLVYATVSNNLANGLGSFWVLNFSATFFHDYYEQLPLFFGIQAIFFKVLGSSIYTERIFSFLMACLTAFFILLTWRLVFKNKEEQAHDWMPVLFWITTPICFWAYTNNVEECLMSVFATASVYVILKGLISQKQLYLHLILGGVLIFLCSFCKGFQGLFMIVTVAVYWLLFRKISLLKALGLSLILALVPLLIYAGLLLNDNAFESLSAWMNNRLVRTFTVASSATTDNRFALIIRLFRELIPTLILALIGWLMHKYVMRLPKPALKVRWAVFFMLIGICGSFPLIITLEQRSFYLVSSLPFYAMSFAVLLAPYLSDFAIDTNSKSFRAFLYSSYVILLMVLVFSFMQIGKTKRDKDKIHDVHMVGAHIPPKGIISVPLELREDWSLGAYFARYYYISMELSGHLPYYLIKKDGEPDFAYPYKEVELGLRKYSLFERVERE